MIGPGWMPSRPRPLPKVGRLLWAYTPGHVRRRRRRRPPSTATAHEPVDLTEYATPLELPTARLLGRSQPRYRALAADLHHWIAHRWSWLRPRTVPIVVALAGMFAVIGAARYLSSLARGTPSWVEVRETTMVHRIVDRPRRAPRTVDVARMCREMPGGTLVILGPGRNIVTCP